MEVGLSHTAVSKVIARYEAEGIAALAPRRRGRRAGEDRALDRRTGNLDPLTSLILCMDTLSVDMTHSLEKGRSVRQSL